MLFTTFFAVLFLFSVVLPSDAGRSSKVKLKSKMEEFQVVPDMIDSAPANVLQVSYGPHVKVQMGNELTPTQVKSLPTELRWPTQPKTLYTLMYVTNFSIHSYKNNLTIFNRLSKNSMADLDAPSRADPKDREGLHWLIVRNKHKNQVHFLAVVCQSIKTVHKLLQKSRLDFCDCCKATDRKPKFR